ncbi:hypothetical protein PISL3812_09572 [Talaromyces islandicus]|uniref:PHD-type domain-containing protein n=1 Tax=Talaromyces islandicus TaxID=28573 RepID=A0A0U1MBQ2_TALIS|nr:hypothetical protein PISL3812_09572 [Talaromyces islandicus]
MDSKHNRVSQGAESSTSETPGDTSLLQATQSSPPLSQPQGPDVGDTDAIKLSHSQATQIPKLSESTVQLLASIGASSPRTKAEEPGRALSDTPAIATQNSSWDPTLGMESSLHPMQVLRNRAIAPRPLAPAPAPSQNHAATATLDAAIEATQEFKPPLQPRPLAPAFINLAPKPDNLPVAERSVLEGQPPPPSSAAVPPLSTLLENQLTPLKPAVRKTPIKSSARPRKRRRVRGSEDEIKAGDSSSDDSSDDMVPVARQTKSGRQVNRPTFFAPLPEEKISSPSGSPNAAGTPVVKRRRKVYRKNGKDINITCKHCQRGHSPSTNMIVFCDECNVAWHQFCHNPPIGKELIEVEETQWFCAECRPAKPVALIKLKLPRSDISTPLNLSRPLVGGELFTTEQRRGYLSSLSHTTLVEMLMNLSQSNPALPLFPENLGDLAASKFAMSPLNKPMPQHEPKETPSHVEENVKERVVKPVEVESNKSKKRHGKKSRTEDSDDSGSEYEVEEHRLYPQPGNGFCLPPEEDDLDILLDDPNCPTFSHTIHNYAEGNTLAESSLAISVTA